MYTVTMQITLSIPEFTRNERNVHCDVLHITPDRVRFRFRFRFIYLVILQTQETSAKTKSGRCRRGHLEKNKIYSIHVCTNNSKY